MSWRVIATLPVLPTAVVSAFILISVDTEIEIGRRAQAETVSRLGRVADVATTTYIRGVGHALAAKAGGPPFPYSFDVANQAEINAFSLPGGPVWIHRGAIVAARSEAELAGVLAHEVAHISCRHAAEQLSGEIVSHLGLTLLSALLGNGLSAGTTQVAAQALTGGVLLKFSRDDEREADAAGMAMMAKAGWDPRGLIEFLEGVRATARRQPSAVDVFFSSHPAPEARIAALRALVKTLPRGRRTSAAFEALRSRLSHRSSGAQEK